MRAGLVVVGLLATLSAQAVVVVFPDSGLEAAVRSAIGKPTGDILETDLVGTGFTYLDAFYLGITDLTGIEYCTDLTTLYLYSNQISDISPVAGLTNLTWLRLDNNQISDISPVASLTNLTTLDLSWNQISDISPVAGLTNLTWLFLSENQTSDISPVAGLTNLTWLCLVNNQISDISPVAGLTNLMGLDLDDNHISDISALVANPGIGSGDFVYLEGNPLDQNALCNDIPTIEGRGVYVFYDGVCSGEGDLVITQQPAGGLFYVGDSHTFTIETTGGLPPLSYQWRLNTSNIDGATTTALRLTPLTLGDVGGYDCVINHSGTDSVTSNVAPLNVADHLAITVPPVGDTLKLGDPYTLFVGTEGGYLPLTYQWIKNGTDNIPDANESSYEITSFAEANIGSYTVNVHDNFTDEETSFPPALLDLAMPVMGFTGLAALLGGCLLAGVAILRRKSNTNSPPTASSETSL